MSTTPLKRCLDMADRIIIDGYEIENVEFRDNGKIVCACDEDNRWTFVDQPVELDDEGSASATTTRNHEVTLDFTMRRPMLERDVVGTPATLDSNEDLVLDLLKFSKFGAMGQVFIVEAIRSYADDMAARDPATVGNGLVAGQAWVDIAKDVQARCGAFYGRHERGESAHAESATLQPIVQCESTDDSPAP